MSAGDKRKAPLPGRASALPGMAAIKYALGGAPTSLRKKPRTVTTESELIALPVGSVVLSESYTHYLDGMRIAFQKWSDEAWHRGRRAGSTHPDNFLPATVIYEPKD